MWHATTTRRSKNAALATPVDIRTCMYFRAVADGHEPRSLEAQADSIRAFIAIHTDWQLLLHASAIRPTSLTADNRTA